MDENRRAGAERQVRKSWRHREESMECGDTETDSETEGVCDL